MTFEFEIVGKMPLIMHQDSIEGADAVSKWIISPEGKKLSVPGDDRTPAWKWHYCLYHDGENVVIPFDVLMGAIRMGAMRVPIDPSGRKRGNFEKLSQSGLMLHQESTVLVVQGHPVKIADVEKFRDLSFAEQAQQVKKLDFQLWVKPVRMDNGRGRKTRNIRVRPRFDEWKTSGLIEITDPIITPEALGRIMDASGVYGGFLDYRPGVTWPGKPGFYGTYTVRLKAA